MQRVKIIGAILAFASVLYGCGSVTLAPQSDYVISAVDSGVGVPVTESGVVSTNVASGTAPDASGDGSFVDGGLEDSHRPITDGPMESAPAETQPTVDSSNCASGVCYPKSDPNHIDCPCHY